LCNFSYIPFIGDNKNKKGKMLLEKVQCSRGSTSVAQGKAHATRVINAGGSIAEARRVMLFNAEAKGVPLKGKAGRKVMETAFDTQVEIGKARLEVDRAKALLTKAEKDSDLPKGAVMSNVPEVWRRQQTAKENLEKAKGLVASKERKLTELTGVQQSKTTTSGELGRVVSSKEVNRPLTDGEKMRMNAYIGFRSGEQKTQGQNLAKKINETTGSNLSPTDAFVINKYATSSYYVAANEVLRGGETKKGLATQQAQLAYARQLNQSLKKLPEYKGEVTRVTSISNKDLEGYKVGATFTWNGMTSTTKTQGGIGAYGSTTGEQSAKPYYNSRGEVIAQTIDFKKTHAVSGYRNKSYQEHGFTPPVSNDVTPVTFNIKSKSGRDISAIGRDGDNEVLFTHGFKGKVTNRKGNTIFIEEL